MQETINFSLYTGITGQSGVGKDEMINILCGIYKKNNIPFELINNGPLFVTESKEDTLFGRKTKEIYEAAAIHPLIVSVGNYFPIIRKALNEGKHVIHGGSPRQVGEARILAGLLNSGYCKSMETIELYAEEKTCIGRMAERAKLTKRLDSSIDGQPGVPDEGKIKRKMKWWTENRDGVISEILTTKMKYTLLRNEGTLSDLGEAVKDMFQL